MELTELNLAKRTNRSQGRDRRSRSFGTKLTRAEEAELYKAAESQGKYAGEWAREVLLREARGAKSDVLLTEIVAMRMMLNSLLRPLSCGETITPDDFTAQMMTIRTTKQKVAQEILQQYAAMTAREANGREWSANEWSNKRQGWIFLTSTENTQEALRPLHSLWIDSLI